MYSAGSNGQKIYNLYDEKIIFVRAMSMVFSIIYFESFYEYFSSDVIIWIMHLFLVYE